MKGSLRKKVARAVTIVLFGLLILSFAVWGIGDVVRGVGQEVAVAEVGDQSIRQAAFSAQLSREMNRLRQSFGGQFDTEQARALGLVDQVLQQMITRSLYEEQADRMGLAASDDQIRARIAREPSFLDESGAFSRARFDRVLQMSNMSEDEFVAAMRADVKRQQLADSLTGGVAVPRPLTEALYAYQEEQRVANTALIAYDSITELPTPDEDTLTAFYKEKAEDFQAPEYRAITLVRLTPDDLLDEVAVSEEDLREEFEARRDEFAVPERRTMEQIVFSDGETTEEARQRLEAGVEFAAVAQEFTGAPPVDLGTLSREEMLGELAEPAFALQPNAVSEPIESPFGWHIIRVVEAEPGREPSFEETREELWRELATRQAIDSMVSIANQFDDELAAGATIEEAARALDLKVHKIPAVDRQGNAPDGEPVEELPTDNEFLPLVFETPAGETSLLSETAAGGYFIVRVDGVTPPATRPFAEVREEVVDRWTTEQREKLARERAQAIADQARKGDGLKAAAEAEGLEVVTSEPMTRDESDPTVAPSPALPQALFAMAEGDVTTVPARGGILVAELADIKPVDAQADGDEFDALRDQLATAIKGDLLAEFSRALHQDFDVTVNRRVLNDIVDQN